ncbi:TPA: hypothetical protein DIS56_00630 [Candidatus Saccharibacteria bacterium]|nr:MAG: hypothetical protein A3F05_03055 [Candidatus Saccharibacteria bacterium RIFCSPHIGHO2_12_FULL_47_17]HCM51629.1 hypothetical protein [Candidatus Saccharibacteria bacterium]
MPRARGENLASVLGSAGSRYQQGGMHDHQFMNLMARADEILAEEKEYGPDATEAAQLIFDAMTLDLNIYMRHGIGNAVARLDGMRVGLGRFGAGAQVQIEAAG